MLAPENILLDDLLTWDAKNEVLAYRKITLAKTAVERQKWTKEKTWVFSGITAIHPLTWEELPIWFADYVLADYGSGAVMMVPAHDERDNAFAEKFWISIVQVIDGKISEWSSIVREGTLINSDTYNWLTHLEAKKKVTETLANRWVGREKVTYKLRDRSVSRQRYWGSPIPVYYKNCLVDELWEEIDTHKYEKLQLLAKEVRKIAQEVWGDFALFWWLAVSLAAWCHYRNHADIDGVFTWEYMEKFQDLLTARWYTLSVDNGWKVYTSCHKDWIEIEYNSIQLFMSSWPEEILEWNIDYQEKNGYLFLSDRILKNIKIYMKKKRSERKDEIDLRILNGEKIVCEEKDIHQLIPEAELPVELPLDIENYKPRGKSPLADHPSFPVYEKDGKKYMRECDTLDTFMCSSFYYLRFPDAQNPDALIKKELADKCFPIDMYSGGKEHTVWHLLYSRFIHKFLFDKGYVSSAEPFSKLIHQWMVLWADGRKMWKRWGNGVDPLEMIENYGADALRMYLMFMWPVEQDKTWNDGALHGVKKFLDRVERLCTMDWRGQENIEVESLMHETIRWITYDMEHMKFNTVVSKLMILVNGIYEHESVSTNQLEILTLLIAPFATELAENMWLLLWHSDDVHYASWPVADESKIVQSSINLPIQINGKMRWKMNIQPGLSEKEVVAQAKEIENIKKRLEGKEIRKIIWIQDKILNLIVG